MKNLWDWVVVSMAVIMLLIWLFFAFSVLWKILKSRMHKTPITPELKRKVSVIIRGAVFAIITIVALIVKLSG